MSRYTKHIGVGEPLIINGEEFVLKPLGTSELPLFFKMMKCFSGATDENASFEDILKNLDNEGLNSMKDIIETTLKSSFPDEDENEMKQFGLKYMQQLLPKIMEINSANTSSNSKAEKIKAYQSKNV